MSLCLQSAQSNAWYSMSYFYSPVIVIIIAIIIISQLGLLTGAAGCDK